MANELALQMLRSKAIDASGIDYLLGDIEDGSRPAQVILRAYEQCLMQLLRGANWDFARKTAPLVLLADATGNIPRSVYTVVPVPCIYAYGYPVDCVKARFIPWNQATQNPGIPSGNITTGFTVQGLPQSPPGTPPVGGLGNPQLTGQRIRPARFVVATSANYPATPDSVDTIGASPTGRTVILTNVQSAFLIYTQLVLYPSQWDPLFRAALVSYLASEIALPLAADKKFGMAMRRDNIAVAKAEDRTGPDKRRQRRASTRPICGSIGWPRAGPAARADGETIMPMAEGRLCRGAAGGTPVASQTARPTRGPRSWPFLSSKQRFPPARSHLIYSAVST